MSLSKRNQLLYLSVFRLLLVAILALSQNSFANGISEQAKDLINQMSEAGHRLNYDGVFIYRRGNQMDTMRLIHKAEEGKKETERLVSLSGYAREVIRNEKGVTCIFPDDEKVMVDRMRPRKFISGQLPEPIETIEPYYNFYVAGEDRIAGHEAWIVNVIPKDAYRYGYQIWIDKESKLLLKSELKTQAGNVIEQVMFTQLQVLNDVPDELLKPGLTGENYTWYEHDYDKSTGETAATQWQVNWLPAGFSMSDHEQQTITSNKMPMDHIVYSDGMAMVSVFIEKLENKNGGQIGPSQMGGVNAFATYSSGYQVTVVGEVPLTTVQLMANSVIRNSN